MINYDELWTTHRCLEIISNKKNQLFKIRVTRVNPGDNMCDEYLLERFHLKRQHLRIFFEAEYPSTKTLFKNLNSREKLVSQWGKMGHRAYPAKYMRRIPNLILFEVNRDGFELPFDDNIDGKNKYLKPEYFHIKIYRDQKAKGNPYYKRTFKKIKNISKDKSTLQFKGISFYVHPTSYFHETYEEFIILGGAKLSEFTFAQDFGDEFKKLGSELKSDFKQLGSEMKSDFKDIFSSFNIFKKKRK